MSKESEYRELNNILSIRQFIDQPLPTNGDMIRAMTDEQMAEELAEWTWSVPLTGNEITAWLKQAKEGK